MEASISLGQQPRRATKPGTEELERRRKIERLTDLCDRLLQRGVLVYDSTRELLAIEVRERKGEQLRKEGEETEDGNVDSSGADVSDAKTPPSSDGSMAPATGGNNGYSATSTTNSSGQNAAVGSVLYENKRYQPTGGHAIATAIEGDAAAEATSMVASRRLSVAIPVVDTSR